jgi:hypothetical protein
MKTITPATGQDHSVQTDTRTGFGCTVPLQQPPQVPRLRRITKMKFGGFGAGIRQMDPPSFAPDAQVRGTGGAWLRYPLRLALVNRRRIGPCTGGGQRSDPKQQGEPARQSNPFACMAKYRHRSLPSRLVVRRADPNEQADLSLPAPDEKYENRALMEF